MEKSTGSLRQKHIQTKVRKKWTEMKTTTPELAEGVRDLLDLPFGLGPDFHSRFHEQLKPEEKIGPVQSVAALQPRQSLDMN